MDPFFKKVRKFTVFFATKYIISSVLIVCQKNARALFKGLALPFKMSIRKKKSLY